MPYDFAKKKKTPGQLKEAAIRRDSFKASTKPKTRRQPKRSVSY